MLKKPVAATVVLLVANPVTAAPSARAQAAPTATSPAGSASDTRRATPTRGWSVELQRRVTSDQGQLLRTARTFQTVGITWDGGEAPGMQIRTLSVRGWSDWKEVDGLLGGTAMGSEPVWVGPARAARFRVDEWRPGLEAAFVDSGHRPGDADAGEEPATTARTAGAAGATRLADDDPWAPMPRILRRKRWGANEGWRDGDPRYTSKIKQAHIHHTASSASYTRSEVPGILRGMYYYHTHQLGWSDIGYNFLVDKFGRIWEGRAGGVGRKVYGAHTLGFNHASFGIASISNHAEAPARKRMRTAVVRLAAWKLDANGREPAGKTWIYSHGSDRFPAGQRVRLPVIDGHRDTNETECPGRRLYRILPGLRDRAQKRADTYN